MKNRPVTDRLLAKLMMNSIADVFGAIPELSGPLGTLFVLAVTKNSSGNAPLQKAAMELLNEALQEATAEADGTAVSMEQAVG